MENKIDKLTEREMEVFSNELLNDFEMMETFAGGNNNGCTNNRCGVNINFFCGNNCVFKSWFNCSETK
ncbi:MAG: hypothetical protein COS14_02145 [Bacteroidetes bacterium CG02_land_8_20_14_3_00_31_25]|nr:hypothetical protein [Bacteroidota bacterium]PIV62416.1 MAG: hypothetical protein COS14_02145 [Bacteroidetes bacterium CG02_land_8_20_14_3_00_31_25]PIX32875.1 MAG: hypothetical protein COZ59_11675 [Bacteroidetes bacterium CG_4_8_14_3_um_filter_31_14]